MVQPFESDVITKLLTEVLHAFPGFVASRAMLAPLKLKYS